MEEPMEVPAVSLNQTVRVGFTLKRALEEAARAEGCDATYLARRLLREQLGVQERSLWPKSEQ
ncbi:MAG TPA: hypothetical protein VGP69_03615 [Gaiellaceae bacterium]|jgi:hypothetical protein|nr:hypothetical protein [Gaiellaceae bacterium]